MITASWMVQVWEDGGWADYWPVTANGTSRRAAVKRAPRVFCGLFHKRYATGALRWRLGRHLRTHAHVPAL